MRLFETVDKEADEALAFTYATLPQNAFYRSGYGGYSKASFFIISIFNVSLAFFLLCMLFPLMATLAFVIKIVDPGPIFYRGTRLGIHKQPFYMYKFRTLPVGSQNKIGALLYCEEIMKLNVFSKFMRDTRLDELPQLFNVLKGDMDFVGPRPVRPEVYTKVKDTITNYDLRFSIRPGLIGFSQLFTPHSAPKRLRARINNKFIKIKRNLFWDIIIIAYTGSVLVRGVFVRGGHLLYRNVFQGMILGSFQEKRRYERKTHTNMKISVSCAKDAPEYLAELKDINEMYFRMECDEELPDGKLCFSLCRTFRRNTRRKKKRTHCIGTVYRKSENAHARHMKYTYIVEYKPKSPFNAYIIDKYFLDKSII